MGFGRYQPTRATEHVRTQIYQVGNGTIAAPDSITGMVAWHTGTKPSLINSGSPASGDSVATLKDFTANHNDYAQATGANQPIYIDDLFNGKAGLRFFGKWMTNSNNLIGGGSNPFTIFAVVSYDGDYTGHFSYLNAFTVDGAGNDVLWAFSDSAGFQYMCFGGKPGTTGKIPGIHVTDFPPGTGLFFIAITYDGSNTVAGVKAYNKSTTGLTVASASDDSDTTSTNYLGSWTATASNSFHGNFHDEIIYNRVLNTTELGTLFTWAKSTYYTRDGGTSPRIGPGGGNLASGAAPVLTNPRVSQTTLNNDPAGLLLNGTNLFITYYQENNGAPRMEKWDVSNPASPSKTDTFAAVGSYAPFSITKGQGNYAFIPLYKNSQVAVMDLTKALSTGAAQVATLSTTASPQYCWTWGNYLAIVCGNSTTPQWQLLHIADPTKPSTVFSYTFQGHDSPSSGIAISNDGYIYVATAGNSQNAFIGVFNANDLSNISMTGSYTFPGGVGATVAESVYLELVGDRLYMSDYFESKVWVWDISARNSPSLLYTFTVPTNPVQIEVAGNYAYVLSNGGNCIDVWDISSNSAATHFGTINTSATTGPQAMYLDVAGGYIYVVLAGTQGPEGTFAVNKLEIYKIT